MRTFWGVLTIGLIVVGFLVPLAWIGAIVTGLLTIGSRPVGTRADGERRTGGLFGGMIDSGAVKQNTKECPYCKTPIKIQSLKCPHCAEWVAQPDTEREVKCPGCWKNFTVKYGATGKAGCPHCGQTYDVDVLR